MTDPLYGRHIRPFHGTLPDQSSPLGRWIADVAAMLHVDYDTASISNAVESLVRQPASPEDVIGPADMDTMRAIRVAHLVRNGGTPNGGEATIRRALVALDDARRLDIVTLDPPTTSEPTSEAAADGGTKVYAAIIHNGGGRSEIVGVSTAAEGAYAYLGAEWVRITDGGQPSTHDLPEMQIIEIDDAVDHILRRGE